MNIERVAWSDEATRGLSECLKPAGGDPGRLPEQVKAGLIDLWRVDGGRCYVATEARGESLFVHALEGRDAGALIGEIIESARRCGFRYVDFHTHRAGMGRFMGRWGFEYLGPSEGLEGYRLGIF